MKRNMLLTLIFASALTILAGAQTTVTTSGMTTSQLPKASGSATAIDSQITDNGTSVGINDPSPEAGAILSSKPTTCSQYSKFGKSAWSIRLGCLSNGTQFFGVGVNKTGNDNIYRAMTGNNALVNHSILEFNYPGGITMYQVAHQTDGTDLTSLLNPSFAIDVNGKVGIGTLSPTSMLSVGGNQDVSGDLNVTGDLTVGGQINTHLITTTTNAGSITIAAGDTSTGATHAGDLVLEAGQNVTTASNSGKVVVNATNTEIDLNGPIKINSDISFNSAPRFTFTGVLPGLLTDWNSQSGFQWTPDKAITFTHLEAMYSGAGVGCSTAGVIQLLDTNNGNNLAVSVSNTSPISATGTFNVAAGHTVVFYLQTNPVCTTPPKNVTLVASYHMQ